MKTFGRSGEGFFAIPSAVESDIKEHYGVQRVGTAEGVRERFYAISVERKLKHPAVVAISEKAKMSFHEFAMHRKTRDRKTGIPMGSGRSIDLTRHIDKQY